MDLRQLFLQHIAPTVPEPLAMEFTHAKGVMLHRADGESLMDLISGIGVANVGHSNPKVIQAVQNQAASYMHLMVYGEIMQQPQVMYAAKLCQALHASLNSVYWTNSGTEAIEGAMKVAKKVTGRTGFISFQGSYHGSSHGAMSAMGNEDFKRAYRPFLPDYHCFPLGSIEAIEAIGPGTAGVLIEIIQSESGYDVVDPVYLRSLQAACQKHGVMLIVDEIQTGFGRTGNLFAHQSIGIQPDILCLAKALGGGMPLGAFIARREHMLSLSTAPILGHLTTFGGHPVSCAAGLAAMEILETSGWIDQIASKEALIRSTLVHKGIVAIHGKGLMLGIELLDENLAMALAGRLMENGYFLDWFLYSSKRLRLSPPLCITEKELKQACHAFLAHLQQLIDEKPA